MKTQRITKRQALLVGITTVIGGVMQPLFRGLSLWSGNSAWVAIILATVISTAWLLLMLKLAKRFPKQSVAEYLPTIWGKIIGYPLVLLMLLAFLLKATYVLRHVAEFFVATTLPQTPISAVILVLLVLIVAGLFAELEGMVRFNELVLPVIIFSLVWVFIGSGPRFDFWELLPLFSKGYARMPDTVIGVSAYFANLTSLLFIFPLIVDQDKISREAVKTLAISGGVFLGISLNITLALGSALGEVFTWPYLAVVESVTIGIERSEAIFMVVWFLAAFVTIGLFVYVFALGLNQLFPRLKRKWVGLGSLPIIAYLALRADNQPTAIIDHLLINRYTLIAFFVVPLLSLALATVRKQKEELR